MFSWILLLISGILCKDEIKDSLKLDLKDVSKHKSIDEMSSNSEESELFFKYAGFDDAQHRGSSWYSFKTADSAYNSDAGGASKSSSIGSSDEAETESKTSGASSQETAEGKRAARMYRECTPCPTDMLKSYKNIGIRWICASYQRARRSFKSECMMRYRNCQDGTMFVKIYEHRCKNDSFHGRHWFYVYKV